MEQLIFNHASKTLNLDINIIYKINKNELLDIENDNIKEKINIYKTYYNFINNKSCVHFISISYHFLLNFKKNDLKIDLLTITIIILKAFLEKKNTVSYLNENYVNSDEIFNYANDQYFKYLMISKKYMFEKNINTYILHIVSLLKDHNLINEKIIIYSEETYKTFKYWQIANVFYIRDAYSFFNFSYCDFSIIEFNDKYYITTHHYSKTFELNKKNFYSNKSFKIKNMTYIMKKINLRLYVDKLYQENVKLMLTDTIENIEKKIKNNIDSINILYDKSFWTSRTKVELSELQSEISKLNEKVVLIRFCDHNFNNDSIIFPLFMDFRGRKYYSSSISPTNSKILRLSYYYGTYNRNDFNSKNNKYSLPWYSTINNLCESFNYNNNKDFYESYFWCLIGIGKIVMNKNESPIREEKFIEYAISYINNPIILKLEDQAEINHYIRIMKSFNDPIIKKRVILKDATASLNQIFMKKLGPINQNSLNYVNLGNHNEWHDTYIVHKQKFIRYIEEKSIFSKFLNNQITDKVLSRKLIKKMIMIVPYSAGFKKCWENYEKIIEKENLDIQLTKELKELYESFYNFIKKTMQEKHLYAKSTTTLINKINDEFEDARKYVLESETGEADISYYKMKKSSIDKKYVINGVNKRITKLVLTPTTAIDIKNFNTASGANIAHFLDADEIRSIEIELDYCILTIHDSYLIDVNNCTKLIDIKINHYQKAINKFGGNYIINNIFILL